jgi:hypothetical protein
MPGLPRQVELVLDWAQLHKTGLLANWHRCRNKQQPVKIEPLNY